MSVLTDPSAGMLAEAAARLREYFGGEGPEKLFRRMVALSVALHAIGFGLFLGRSATAERSRFDWRSQAVQVSLADVPAPRPVKKKEAPRQVVEPAAESAPAPSPLPGLEVKAPPEAPTPVAKAASQVAPSSADAMFLKRRAEAEEIERARKARAEREAAEEAARRSERERLRQALAALKEQGVPEASVGKEATNRSAADISQDLAETAREQQALAAAQSAALSREAHYEAGVRAEVEKFWKVPAGLARQQELVTTVEFTIDKDGSVRSLRIAQSSGSGAFDDSVERAARQIRKFETPPLGFPPTFSINFRNMRR